MNEKRLNYIDICKAIGILLVLLGHTFGLPHPVYLTIYAFHMPLFFILSGLVYNKEKNESIGFAKFLADKAKRYLIPYFLFAFANLAFEILWKVVYVKEALPANYFALKIKGILLCYSNTENMPNCSPIWFLVCLFIASILFWWLIKLRPRYSLPIVALLGLTNFLLLPFCNDHTSFPFKFPAFLLAVCFLYIGFYLKVILAKCSCLFNHRCLTIISSLSVFALCSCWVIMSQNLVGMNENAYSNYAVFLITSTLMSVSFICLAKAIFSNINLRFMTFLGKNTIYIMGFNYLCRDVATELYYFIPYIKNFPIHWTVSFLLTTAVSIVCILIISLLKRVWTKIAPIHA